MTKNKNKLITKSLNESKRLATFVVLEPQEDDGMTTDLHGDYYDEETILDACIQFMKKNTVKCLNKHLSMSIQSVLVFPV